MKYQFNINLNDNDYMDFNIFAFFHSYYGKRRLLRYRLIIAVMLLICIYFDCFSEGFTKDAFVSAIPSFVFLVAFLLLFVPLFRLFLKAFLSAKKKRGKLGYSPVSVLEFYDDYFIETVENGKSQYNYMAVERISIVDNKTIYIHLNSDMAYILPMSCFEFKDQYDEFVDFLNSKCKCIDTY